MEDASSNFGSAIPFICSFSSIPAFRNASGLRPVGYGADLMRCTFGEVRLMWYLAIELQLKLLGHIAWFRQAGPKIPYRFRRTVHLCTDIDVVLPFFIQRIITDDLDFFVSILLSSRDTPLYCTTSTVSVTDLPSYILSSRIMIFCWTRWTMISSWSVPTTINTPLVHFVAFFKMFATYIVIGKYTWALIIPEACMTTRHRITFGCNAL